MKHNEDDETSRTSSTRNFVRFRMEDDRSTIILAILNCAVMRFYPLSNINHEELIGTGLGTHRVTFRRANIVTT